MLWVPGDLFGKNPVNGLELYVAGFYYSTETITSVGYGDVSPSGLVAKVVGALEMLLGMCFGIFIVSGALEKFAEVGDAHARTHACTCVYMNNIMYAHI